MLRQAPAVLAIVVAVVGVLLFATTAAAAPPPLTGTLMNAQDFYPCPYNHPGPPELADCTRTTPVVVADCHPDGISTLSFTRNGIVYGANYNASYVSDTLTATIGPQTGNPEPAFQPFQNSGLQVSSIGFKTGRILSWHQHVTITSGGTTIAADTSLIDDLANVGVCREYHDQAADTPVFQGTISGFFYLLNAGRLQYDATLTDIDGPVSESGEAEAYLGDSYATCCSEASPIGLNSAEGHLIQQFGTSHPFTGTTVHVPTGTDLTFTPVPGLSVNFDGISGDETTTLDVEMRNPSQLAPIPQGFLLGDPPMLYEIHVTNGTYSGDIRVCAPYGSAPANTTPKLLHYEGGNWVPAQNITFDDDTRVVCGTVTSLSPFAATFVPDSTPVTVKAWVGLKNSDDVGVKFDLKADVTVGGHMETANVLSAPAGSSGFNNAKLDAIAVTVPGSVGSGFTLTLSVRNACTGSGHNSGTARLWFDDPAAGSGLFAGIESYYLHPAFVASERPGTGPKKTIDVAAGAKCSAWKPFGTWTFAGPS